MKPSKAELLRIAVHNAMVDAVVLQDDSEFAWNNAVEAICKAIESLPDEPAPSPADLAQWEELVEPMRAEMVAAGVDTFRLDLNVCGVPHLLHERDELLRKVNDVPPPASDDHIAGVGKMIAPSSTKPEGGFDTSDYVIVGHDGVPRRNTTKPEGLECPAEYAHPFFVYDFMPQKIMFKSDRGDDTMALDVLSVRGWGHLIGHGQAGLKINEQAAAEIQDNFGKWVANTLTATLSPVSDADTVTLSDLSRIEHAFRAIEEYGNQEALDEMAELIEELKAVAVTDTVRVKRDTVAYLVERHHTDRIEYVSMANMGVEWVSDADKALWCVRRSDAEQLAAGSFDGDDIRIVEHMWPEVSADPNDDRLRASLNGGAL